MSDRGRKRQVRVSVPVTIEALSRVDALVDAAPGSRKPDKAALLAEAIERGLAQMEADARIHEREVAARRAALERVEIPDEESGHVFQREDHLAFGSRRDIENRREGERGLDAGRREGDRRRARAAFVERVIALANEGLTYPEIADLLNEEKTTTSRGQPWSGNAIGQLVRTEREKRARLAWRPSFLK